MCLSNKVIYHCNSNSLCFLKTPTFLTYSLLPWFFLFPSLYLSSYKPFCSFYVPSPIREGLCSPMCCLPASLHFQLSFVNILSSPTSCLWDSDKDYDSHFFSCYSVSHTYSVLSKMCSPIFTKCFNLFLDPRSSSVEGFDTFSSQWSNMHYGLRSWVRKSCSTFKRWD